MTTNKDSHDIFIGRQPILDRNQNLFAYELLFRSGQAENSAVIDDNLSATASVLSHAFADLGAEQALGPYKGFVNCDETLLMSDFLEALPADKIVLEVLETVEVTPQIVERCAYLKQLGFTLAIDDFVDDVATWEPLLALADIVKVELLALDREALAKTTAALKKWPLKLLAEKVDSREQADYCMELGYDLFQGYYFSKPVIISGRKIGQSQAALMRLMTLVMKDAETAELETAFKQEPGLTINLLRLTNSVATGARMKITSLRHAITILGRRQLQRWLQLVLYTNPQGNGMASPLMHLAATRGRLLELVAGKVKPGRDEFEDFAFITGIMSLMPALLGVPMENILQGLDLDASVVGALNVHEGELGALLTLAEALETGDGASCQALADMLGSDAETINTCLTQALTWAGNISREAGHD